MNYGNGRCGTVPIRVPLRLVLLKAGHMERVPLSPIRKDSIMGVFVPPSSKKDLQRHSSA
jgi:hypothetical protein